MRRRVIAILGDVLVCAIGLSSSFTVRVIGLLPISEIVIVGVLPILLGAYGKRIWTKRTKVIFGFIAIWLLGQVLTDIYRNTEPRDWMRGDAVIIFFAFTFGAFTILISKNERRKGLIIASFALGSLLAAFQSSSFPDDDAWKWGYASGASMLALLAASFFSSRRRYGIMLLIVAAIILPTLLDNFRSQLLCLVLSVFLTVPIIPERIGRIRLLPRSGSAIRIVVLAAYVGTAGLGTMSLVRLAASRGLLSEEAAAKNEEQSRMRGGILLGARPEWFVSSQAVLDSPILGHGSWARDYKYVEMLADIMERNGLQAGADEADKESEGFIPSHSHLMGAWVQAGILGAVFWVYIASITFRAIVGVSVLRPPLAPLYALMFVGFFWAILFSPGGGTTVIPDSISLVIALDLLGTPEVGRRRNRWRRARLRPLVTAPIVASNRNHASAFEGNA